MTTRICGRNLFDVLQRFLVFEHSVLRCFHNWCKTCDFYGYRFAVETRREIYHNLPGMIRATLLHADSVSMFGNLLIILMDDVVYNQKDFQ